MKNIYLLLTLLLLVTGCAENQPKTPEIKETKNFYFPDEFIYKKEQILFFEKEFNRILKLNNKELLQTYADFYKRNESYFTNGLEKAQMIEDKIKKDKMIYIKNSHKSLLTKALSTNKEDAIKIYLKLAEENNIFAQRELAEIYKISDPIKSIFWYEKLISNNDIKSMKDYAYANIYMIRPIIVQNVKRAVSIYEELEKLGEVSVLMHLGNIYEYGYFKDDIPQNREKALEYYKKASSKNYTNAQKKLSQIYLCKSCEGNRFNKEEGLKLLKILASKGDEESIKKLEKISEEMQKATKKEIIQEETIQEETEILNEEIGNQEEIKIDKTIKQEVQEEEKHLEQIEESEK